MQSDLTREDAWRLIEDHELSVRRLPTGDKVSMYEMRYHKEGNEIHEKVMSNYTPGKAQAFIDREESKGHNKHGDFFIRESDGQLMRRYTVERTPRNYPGWWMVKKIDHTSETVKWSRTDDHAAPTLMESVQSWLNANT